MPGLDDLPLAGLRVEAVVRHAAVGRIPLDVPRASRNSSNPYDPSFARPGAYRGVLESGIGWDGL